MPLQNPPQETLTERELSILTLMAEGHTNQHIAAELSLSVNTIKWYSHRIYTKLNVNRRTQAVAVAQSRGLLRTNESTVLSHGDIILPLPPYFTGREDELAHLKTLIDDPECRLISVVGTGGIGKTSLVAAWVHQRSKDAQISVYYVPLESVKTFNQMIQAIAQVADVRFGGQRDLFQQLVLGLKRRQLILVLDNYEHLISDTSDLVRLLAQLPQLKLIVTTRERLNVKFETVLLLRGLAISAAPDISSANVPAVQLFLRIYQQHHGRDTANTLDMDTIVQICKQVEGMPLAIEIAVAWLDVISIQQVLAEIEAGLGIFQAPHRDMPDRHRSIQGMFEASWEMLTANDQKVLAKLSVFRGEFGRQAAEAITGASLLGLRRLVNRSLLKLTSGTSYKLHELLRQFAKDKLSETPEVMQHTHYRFCQYYADLLYRYEQDRLNKLALFTPHMIAMIGEQNNIFHGWELALTEPYISEISKYALNMTLIYQHTGAYPSAISQFEKAIFLLRDTSTRADQLGLICVLTFAAYFAVALGDFNKGGEYCREAIDLSDDVNEADVYAKVIPLQCLQLCIREITHGPPIHIDPTLNMVQAAQEAQVAYGEYIGLYCVGELYALKGDYAKSLTYHQQAQDVAQNNEFELGIAASVSMIAFACVMLGRFKQGLDRISDALKLAPYLLHNEVFAILTAIAIIEHAHGQKQISYHILAISKFHYQIGFYERFRVEQTWNRLTSSLTDQKKADLLRLAEDRQLENPYVTTNFTITPTFVKNLIVQVSAIEIAE